MEKEQDPKHNASSPGGNSALELFQIPPTDTSILSARWQPYYPESRIQRGSPIEFNIETTPDSIDLSKCYMKFKLKITKANGADIKDKRIDLQPEAFCLMSTAGTERVETLNAEFMVRYVKINDTVRLQHIAIMSGAGRKHPQPALYPLERGDVQVYNIAQGQSSFQKNDLFLGKVPRRVVVGLVRNDAYVGDKARNPFNFQLFNLKSLKLLVNGEEYPAPGIELCLEVEPCTEVKGFKWNA